MKSPIQFNADLGEGTGAEDLMMPFLSYCNIACGGHTGNVESITKCINLASKHEVKIGAHPSYPDTKNFGREVLDIPPYELEESLVQQLTLIKEIAHSLQIQIYHVKAHGALYHQVLNDMHTQEVFLRSVDNVFGKKIKIFLPSHASFQEVQIDSNRIIFEAFGDRKYNDQSQLLPRSLKGSVLQSVEDIYNQVELLTESSNIISDNNKKVIVQFDTICLHGDHPHLLDYFPKLVKRLKHNKLL